MAQSIYLTEERLKILPTLHTLDLVVPLYNEAGNIEKLVEDTADTDLPNQGLRSMILVNNGSTDNTAVLLEKLAAKYSWVKPVTLEVNRMYGGGIHYGMLQASADYIGLLPGDNQVHPSDALAVWKRLLKLKNEVGSPYVFVKGKRTVRHDGASMQFASSFYTHYTNLMLHLDISDVNGHPKMFHRSLVNLLPDELMRTFTLDAQMLYTARQADWHLAEEPVTFLARRSGVSSWATKRLQIYASSAKQILQIRRIQQERIRTKSNNIADIPQVSYK